MKEPAHYPEQSVLLTRLNTYFIPGSGYTPNSLKCLLLALIALFPSTMLKAADMLNEAWKKGNAFYQQKEYDSAAHYFEIIAAAKPADATVFYNLGNTYYRLNNMGYAVLNYEKALKRKPGYKEAADNLLLTQSRIPGFIQPVKDIFFVTWWKSLTAPATIIAWSVASLLLFIALIGLLLYRRLNRQLYIRPQIIGALTTLWLLSLFMAIAASRSLITDVRAVVVSNNTYLSNKTSKGVITLPVGTTVRIISGNNTASCEVELEDNRSGYVRRDQLKVVE